MGRLVYSELATDIKSLRWSINNRCSCAEYQLCWLVELVVAEEFRQHPEWANGHFNKPVNINTTRVSFNSLEERDVWRTLRLARNKVYT